ncbi:MAG: type VI secretion system baseplate subunit TssK [Leptothrix sp. (in: b-proteobacteria)]
MSWVDPVVWSQGMFLQPHHFQQEARHVGHRLDARLRSLRPDAWGYTELLLDDSLLALGRIGIARATGVLPDGTPFAIPQLDAVPAPLDVPADSKGELIYLAAPVSREGVTEIDFGDARADELRRYRVATEERRDHVNASDEPEPIQTAALNLRLLRAKELSDAYAGLGVVRVIERRADGQLLLDRSYIAPQTRIEASGQLSSSATLLHGLVRQRAQLLASQMGQIGAGVSEVAEFLMLLVLNRNEPLLRQFAGAPSVHPREFHLACLQLAGELSTFRTEARCVADYPLYRHDDLQATFLPLIEDLRRMLATLVDRQALQIELVEHRWGRTALVADLDLLRKGALVLAVNAQLPGEQVRQRFPAQSKLAPVDRIRDLVNLALPGINLRSLPVAPRQLPFHAGFHYFELERGGELWKQLEGSGALALHVAGEFPGLELELWAIRS